MLNKAFCFRGCKVCSLTHSLSSFIHFYCPTPLPLFPFSVILLIIEGVARRFACLYGTNTFNTTNNYTYDFTSSLSLTSHIFYEVLEIPNYDFSSSCTWSKFLAICLLAMSPRGVHHSTRVLSEHHFWSSLTKDSFVLSSTMRHFSQASTD